MEFANLNRENIHEDDFISVQKNRRVEIRKDGELYKIIKILKKFTSRDLIFIFIDFYLYMKYRNTI